jgi:uncharacterized protein (DUF4415 family)
MPQEVQASRLRDGRLCVPRRLSAKPSLIQRAFRRAWTADINRYKVLAMAKDSATKRPFFTRLDPDLLDALRRFKRAAGVPPQFTVNAALREYLNERPAAWPIHAQRPAGRRRK